MSRVLFWGSGPDDRARAGGDFLSARSFLGESGRENLTKLDWSFYFSGVHNFNTFRVVLWGGEEVDATANLSIGSTPSGREEPLRCDTGKRCIHIDLMVVMQEAKPLSIFHRLQQWSLSRGYLIPWEPSPLSSSILAESLGCLFPTWLFAVSTLVGVS